MTKVEQVDREAVVDMIDTYWQGRDKNMNKLSEALKNGHSQGTFVRAFAAHRHAERARIMEALRSPDMVEKVARGWCVAKGIEPDAQTAFGDMDMAYVWQTKSDDATAAIDAIIEQVDEKAK